MRAGALRPDQKEKERDVTTFITSTDFLFYPSAYYELNANDYIDVEDPIYTPLGAETDWTLEEWLSREWNDQVLSLSLSGPFSYYISYLYNVPSLSLSSPLSKFTALHLCH